MKIMYYFGIFYEIFDCNKKVNHVIIMCHRPRSDQSVVPCDKWREMSNNTGKNPIISPTSVIERSLKVNISSSAVPMCCVQLSL